MLIYINLFDWRRSVESIISIGRERCTHTHTVISSSKHHHWSLSLCWSCFHNLRRHREKEFIENPVCSRFLQRKTLQPDKNMSVSTANSTNIPMGKEAREGRHRRWMQREQRRMLAPHTYGLIFLKKAGTFSHWLAPQQQAHILYCPHCPEVPLGQIEKPKRREAENFSCTEG